jgi:hypothetical protein
MEHHQILLATYCLPHIRLPKTPSLYTFILKMAIVMFAETLGNYINIRRSPSRKAEVAH